MSENGEFVFVEWVDELAGFPRYGMATIRHAEELGPNVRWLRTVSTIDAAADAVRQLNAPGTSSASTSETRTSLRFSVRVAEPDGMKTTPKGWSYFSSGWLFRGVIKTPSRSFGHHRVAGESGPCRVSSHRGLQVADYDAVIHCLTPFGARAS